MESATYNIRLDDVSFHLREQRNFNWIHNLGRVFSVFDQQDSGNLCFGLEKDNKKLFLKFAGAKTSEYLGDPADAVARLKKSAVIYEELKHPHLIRLDHAFEIDNGFAAIFDWVDGECLHPHWMFSPQDKYNNPDSPYYRYRRLSVEKRLRSLDSIFDFHLHVASKGYVAVDFYDGSILYDFVHDTTKICDIDFYRRKPAFNDMGEDFWGSKRFKSPEEYQLGAAIDERTNVFTMGAISFGLLGGELDRSFSKWEAGRPLYDVALRATQDNRDERYASLSEFRAAWNNAGPL